MNLALMRQIDEQFLETPFFGVRQMTWHLRNDGHPGEREADSPADAADGADADLPEAQHQQAGEGSQDLSLPAPGLRVDRPNQVWAADITYLPMRRGFLYLVAIMDWHTRKVWPGASRIRWRPTSASRR
jgi:putative transposase